MCKKHYRKWYHRTNREKALKQLNEYYQENKHRWPEYSRRWRRQNREKVSAQNAAYKKNNRVRLRMIEARRRARKRMAPATNFEIHLSGTCFYCGEAADTVDHFIALSRGGGHLPGNLVSACKECNNRKYDKPPEEVLCQLELV